MAGEVPVACRNCGAEVRQEYCPDCGQSRKEERSGFLALLREFTDIYLSYDSKAVRTVTALLFRPGKVTREFLDGQRRRYVSPLRLYIFSTILLFLFLDIPVTDMAIEVAESNRVEAAAEGDGGLRIGTELAADAEPAETALGRWLQRLGARQQERIDKLSDDAKLLVLLGQLVNALPKALFLILPVLALYLKLLLLGTRSLYYDHFIFTLHAQSFVMLVLTVLSQFLAPGPVTLCMLLVSALYWVFALRRVYSIGWPRTVLTMLALSVLAPMTTLVATGALAVYVALSF